MNSIELAKKISLDPRAIVLTGTFRERVKTSDSGQISGFIPHHAMRGCPVLQFGTDGELVPMQQEAGAIEADFSEQPMPETSAITSAYGRPLNMVHLMFGRQGVSANPGEARVLKEAGETFRRTIGQVTHLVALPVFTSAQYGVAAGRLFPLGLFTQNGDPIWVNPVAVGKLLKADYPATQVQRSVAATPAAQVVSQPKTNWYELTSATLAKSTKLAGKKLHDLVLDTRANQLVIAGQAADQATGLRMAKQDYETMQNAAKPPMPPLPAAKTSAAKRLSSARV
ncbi:hypothetical protein [Oleiharenicola sp. Vm1]|uniref:hypothetical protein n=1 Tax=Oleiharenicola sp. Vm1 TaxID=3398393 RepID=UPI0039F4E92D